MAFPGRYIKAEWPSTAGSLRLGQLGDWVGNVYPLATPTTCTSDYEDTIQSWSDIIEVKVGPENQPFVLHRFAAEKIPLLKEQLDVKIGGDLRFLDGGSAAFARIAKYVYRQDLEPEFPNGMESTEDTANATSSLLTAMYANSMLLGLEELANKVTDAYAKHCISFFPAAADLLYLQEKGQETSRLMKLMLHIYAFTIRDQDEHLDYLLEKEAHVFRDFYDAKPKNKDTMLRVLAEIGCRKNPFEEDMDTCEYHTHDVTERCHSNRAPAKKCTGKRKISEGSNGSGSTAVKKLRGGREVVIELDE